MLRSLENEGSEVTSFLESQGLNSTAFSELGDLMTGLEADEVELEDYFNILFNSSEATDLLAASTGANAEAQQAVIDALEGDTEVSFHFLFSYPKMSFNRRYKYLRRHWMMTLLSGERRGGGGDSRHFPINK